MGRARPLLRRDLAGGSTVTGNGIGLEESLGSIETYADNLVHGNVTDVSGTLNVIGKT